jgi:hypothetical protein
MVTIKNPCLLLLALASSSAFAAPTDSAKLSKRMTATCDITFNVLFESYSVWVGAPYAEGSGCNNVFGALQGAGAAVTNWQCVDDGTGNTRLWFNAPLFKNDAVNTALNSMYTVDGGFQCWG